jgi:uroporphyrinogen decarboxylase
MDKRAVMKLVLNWKRPPYVPWTLAFTIPAKEKLQEHFQGCDLDEVLQNHMVSMGNETGFFKDIGEDCVQDIFGVIWDRSTDKDIGNVKGQVLPLPTLKGYTFPNPLDPKVFVDVPNKIEKNRDRFRAFTVGFSLYERAWTLRGLQTLLMDFYDNPKFVHELLATIADYNITQLKEAVKYDIDAVRFGDDWGQQHGLQMGPKFWHEFIYPELKRMYRVVKEAGKYVFIHSCGDVDELFPDLIDIGVDCFNPFQPEVMDTTSLIRQYRGQLAFFGGMSTQQILPYGSVEDVRRETRRLLELGKNGGYIFSPAHDVPKDVPLENMLAFIDVVQHQPEYERMKST